MESPRGFQQSLYCGFPLKSLILNIIEILDSIQAETNKYSAVIDLANIFCSVSSSTDSQLHFALSSKKYNALLGI